MGNDDPKGAYNREPDFKGKQYAYWKEHMYVHLMCIDKHLWVVITDVYFIPKQSL